MSRIDRSQGDLLLRAGLGLIPLAICWWFGRNLADPWMRVGLMFPGLTATALIVFPSWTAAIGFQVSKIYMPWSDEKIRRVVPLHAVDTMLAREQWDEAEKELFRVAREYGGTREVWDRLFEMLWVKAGARDRAARAHRRALTVARSGDERDLVSRMYLVHAERVIADDGELEQERMRARGQREAVETEVMLNRKAPGRGSKAGGKKTDRKRVSEWAWEASRDRGWGRRW